MDKFWVRLKPKLVWILAGVAAAVGLLITIATLGRSRPKFGKTPPRPKLKEVKDVVIPDVRTDFEDTPADNYDDSKVKSNPDTAAVISDLNDSFK